jgi:hypothetical protein
MGCYKTSNGGLNWIRWNNGMPVANIVTEMTVVDSTLANGKYYILAGSYGRSAWLRDISGDDPIYAGNTGTGIPKENKLYQNYPNPFNPNTNIKYQVKEKKLVTLKIYDVLGKEAETLVYKMHSPGTYEVTWNATQYPSGIYFYSITSGNFTKTNKMILIK